MIIRNTLLLMLTATLGISSQAQEIATDTEVETTLHETKQQSPAKKFLNFFTAKNPDYCENSHFKGGIELQDKMQQEYVHFSNEGHRFKTSSGLSNRVGPYFGYQGIYAGTTFDLFAKKDIRRTETAFYANTQLFSAEFLWRRTGGDFSVDEFKMDYGDNTIDMTPKLDDRGIGDDFRNNLTGVNLSFYLNPRKYSNPAGFSRGTIQKRSVGSPVLGLGYSHQKMVFDFYDDGDVDDFINMGKDGFGFDGPDYGTQVIEFLLNSDDDDAQELAALTFLRAASEMKVDDYHLQMGYAYNWVITPRLLFAIQATVDPGIKHLSLKSRGTLANDISLREGTSDYMGSVIKPILDKHKIPYDPTNIMGGNYGSYRDHQTAFDINYNLKASLTYRWNRWRLSSRFLYSAYQYKKHAVTLTDHFWTLRFYVGWNF